MTGDAEEPRDPLTRWIAITLSLLVVVGAAIAIQEATGSVNESNTARETTRVAVRAMSARVALDAVLRAEAGLRGEREFLPYRPPLSAAASPAALQGARAQVPSSRTRAELDRLRFTAEYDTLRQSALATTRITWNDVATRYTTAIAVLAAALFFVGFSLTVEGPPRRIALGLGIATGLFAAGWAVYIHEIAIPGTPRRALAAAAHGSVLAQHRDYAGAARAYSLAIATDGDFAAAYTGRANARLMLANPDYTRTKAFTDVGGQATDAALTDARHALALGGRRDLLGFSVVGVDAIYRGRYAEALRAASDGLAINPRVPDLWLLRSAGATGLGDQRGARDALARALSLLEAAGPSRHVRQLSSDYLSYLAAVAAHVPPLAVAARRLGDRMVAFETAATLERPLDGSLPPTGAVDVTRLRYSRGRFGLVLRWHGLPRGTALSAIEYERPIAGREWTQPAALALFLDAGASGRRRISLRLSRACKPTAVRVDVYLDGVRSLTRTGPGVAGTCP
jgi:tetratricopeptide (TPR) repeat protein